MNLLSKPRGTGKTIALIYTSEATRYPILVSTRAKAERLEERAKELGCDIPKPVTITEFKSDKKLKNIYRDILVDDLEDFLDEALRQYFGSRVLCATLNYKDRGIDNE